MDLTMHEVPRASSHKTNVTILLGFIRQATKSVKLTSLLPGLQAEARILERRGQYGVITPCRHARADE